MNEIAQRRSTAAQQFRQRAEKVAASLLTEWVGEERAKEATGRISAALAASAAAARDPSDFYDCEPASVATVIAITALTGIMPSTGATALAYAIPRRARRGEKPQLQYSLSHRGINALARRCGQTVIAVPISNRDEVDINDAGEFVVFNRDIDKPPMSYEDLRGIQVIVKELASGRVTFSGFVPVALIEPRRAMSDSWANERARPYSPWTKWPVEMAMKTAIHYAVSRGWCVIDDTSATRALTMDQEADLRRDSIDTVARPASIAALTQKVDEPDDTDTEPEEKAKPSPLSFDGLFDSLNACSSLHEVEAVESRFRAADLDPAQMKELSGLIEMARQTYQQSEA